MSQVQRAKKMFDDASSFSEEGVPDNDSAMQHEVEVPPPPAASGAHVDPRAAAAQADSDSDPDTFVPKSASASQPRAEPDNSAAAVAGPMVTRVDVSPPPKEQPLPATTRLHAAQQGGTATPKAAMGVAPTATATAPSKGSAYNTPATVSKRPGEREEVEAAQNARRHASAGKGSAAKGSATGAAKLTPANAAYREREEDDVDAVAFSTMADRGDSHAARLGPHQAAASGDYEMRDVYTPASAYGGRVSAAQQLEYSREDAEEAQEPGRNGAGQRRHSAARAPLLLDTGSDDSDDEDFPCASYIFPRLDPALADHQGTHTAVAAAKRGEAMPPNAVEKWCAYLMVTDIRLAVYLAVLILCLVFVIVSIPTSQLDMAAAACFTYWGYKTNCDSATYTVTRPLYPCAAIRSRLGAGAAFSIITLILLIVNFAAVIIVVCCLREAPHKVSLKSRLVVGVIGAVSVVTQLISWSVVAGIQGGSNCQLEGVTYGVGFGLNISAWVLNLLAVVLMLAVPSDLVNKHQAQRR